MTNKEKLNGILNSVGHLNSRPYETYILMSNIALKLGLEYNVDLHCDLLTGV